MRNCKIWKGKYINSKSLMKITLTILVWRRKLREREKNNIVWCQNFSLKNQQTQMKKIVVRMKREFQKTLSKFITFIIKSKNLRTTPPIPNCSNKPRIRKNCNSKILSPKLRGALLKTLKI